MKKFSIYFLLFFSFSIFAFAETDSPKLKTTGEELREQNISGEELCNIACESEFSKCFGNDKKNSMSCVAKTVSCKNKCKKDGEKK